MNHYSTLLKLLFLLFSYSIQAQNLLEWHIEGSILSPTISADYHSYELRAQYYPTNYIERVHPVVWGYVISKDKDGNLDTCDFELIIDSDNGWGAKSLSFYTANHSLDLQTSFTLSPIDQHFRMKVNLFEYSSRVNTALQAGSGGTPKTMTIGISQPNADPTLVGNLHTGELYYIEAHDLSFSPNFTKEDPCAQIDVFKANQPMLTAGEDIDNTWLMTQNMNGDYPYDVPVGRTYFHTTPVRSTCHIDNLKRLTIEEANYNVYFEPMASFIIGRQDVPKIGKLNTGSRSSIGFKVSPTYKEVDKNPDNTLSVDELYFTGQKMDQYVQLDWRTIGEKDNELFVVERSKDGIQWEAIDEVSGAGTSEEMRSYRSLDYNFHANMSYYRLKSIDIFGIVEYSNIIAIKTAVVSTESIRIWPNPANQYLLMEGVNAQNSSIKVLNYLGQNLSTQTTINKRTNTIELGIEQLPKGSYYIEIIDHTTQQQHVQKFQKN